ncbi:flagellar biosynthesis protein FlhF [Fundidesulfovibrio butyratiphilus]
MRVKTFRGANATAVLAQIKKELGPEAVILSNQTKRENGRSVCEIMAAVEQDTPVSTPDRAPRETAPAQSQGPESAHWLREWSEMKEHLGALLRPHMNYDSLTPRQKLAMQHLEREGVDQSILLGLYRELTRGPNVSLLAELGRIARIKPFDAAWSEKLHLVVGPSGSGKTTVLVRMALSCKRLGKDRRILLVNCDGHASKGRVMLKRYADLAGFSYMEAEGPEEFTHVLLQCRNFDNIYVDLPSLPVGQNLDRWLEERSIATRDDVAAHLVLSPLYGNRQFEAYWERFRSPQVKSLVWTKLDEACSFGAMLNVAAMTGLPASALGFGPAVTGGMVRAQAQALWKLVFTRQLPAARSAQTVEMAA